MSQKYYNINRLGGRPPPAPIAERREGTVKTKYEEPIRHFAR